MSTSTHSQQKVSFEKEVVTDRSIVAEHPTAAPQCCDCGRHLRTANVSEVVCPDCNIVVDDSPPSTRGVPLYTAEDIRNRSSTGGMVTDLRSDGGIGVGVPWNAYCDGKNSRLPSEQRRLFRETHWKKCRTDEEYTLDYGYGEIRRMGSALHIPTPEREHAGRLFKRCLKEQIVAGRCLDGFATASLLVAVRNSDKCNSVLLSEFIEVSRSSKVQLKNARGAIELYLENVSIPPLSPEYLVARVSSELDASGRVERIARDLISAYNDADHSHSFCPRTIVGAAFHAAYDLVGDDDRPSLPTVATTVDVHGSTVSNRKKVITSIRNGQE